MFGTFYIFLFILLKSSSISLISFEIVRTEHSSVYLLYQAHPLSQIVWKLVSGQYFFVSFSILLPHSSFFIYLPFAGRLYFLLHCEIASLETWQTLATFLSISPLLYSFILRSCSSFGSTPNFQIGFQVGIWVCSFLVALYLFSTLRLGI